MPVTPTYPGVYVEEIPSGVRTITGVSTSVTAFVGSAKRGPINKAVHILSYSDFERRFGGLQTDSYMTYAVRQFFLNGGSDAWVVRLAKNAGLAEAVLKDSETPAKDTLQITAIDEGKAGNSIEVRVDHQTSNPACTFTLSLIYAPADDAANAIQERFENLSMNSNDPRYVESMVNGVSKLVTVKRVHDLTGLDRGTSVSGKLEDGAGNLLDVATLRDDTHNQLRVAVNGLEPVKVILAPADLTGTDEATRLEALRATLENRLRNALPSTPALNNLTVTVVDHQLKITSGVAGEQSTVRVLPGERQDIAARLKFGTLNGGVEADAVALIRPAECPLHGTLTSGVFTGDELKTPPLPDAMHTSFKISLDGQGPDTIDLGSTPAANTTDTLAERLADVAARIEGKVRQLRQSLPAYKGFTCTVVDGDKLRFTSGSRGADSSVVVDTAASNSIASELHLLAGTTAFLPTNQMLQGGSEEPYSPSDPEYYGLFIGNRLLRKGIYALDDVDLFNLMCLPGVTDGAVLMDADAYCKERRAFLIVDAPSGQKPEDMVKLISGPTLPKTEYGAVYYPWIKVADPLNGGKLRPIPPSGAIAGLYARTDTARGVWKAPAGTDASVTGAQGTEYTLTDGENGTLNPLGVNSIRSFPVYGVVAWGSRTLRGANEMASEWKYIPVRRTALYIEESLYLGTKWVVFEPNDEPLWAQIRLNIGAFMHNLFRQGAFQGTTPREAYFVKCDKETTTQDDINRGVVNIVVGFAPLKPAEFVIIKLQQMAGQIQT